MEYFASHNLSGAELDEQTATILEFLENDDLTVISAVHNKAQNKIKFQHGLPTDKDECCLLFYKIPQVGSKSSLGQAATATSVAAAAVAAKTAITTNVEQRQPALGILTLEGGLVKSIYNSISRVFSPHSTAARVCSTYIYIDFRLDVCLTNTIWICT